jgi:hypothetical protein
MEMDDDQVLTAEVRSISVAGTDGTPLSKARPEPKFYLPLELDIGIKGQPGTDRFGLWVCSVSWLEEQSFPYLGQWLVVVDRFDAQKIDTFIRSEVMGTSGRTKDELFVKLSRFAAWEFDYAFDRQFRRST